MFYTVFCILCTALLGVLFKTYESTSTKASVIIPVNYMVCFAIGCIHSGTAVFSSFSPGWIPYILVLGCLFIMGFRLFARSIRMAGLPVATLFQKMSVLLTVLFALVLGDSMNNFQFLGVLTGLLSMFLIIDHHNLQSKNFRDYLAVLAGTLIISSCLEILFILIDKWLFLSTNEKLIFPAYLFFVAGILGFISEYWIESKISISKKELFYGIILGIPNFYSIYFLMMTLNREFSGAVFFPLLNCSIIALSCTIGFVFFKEPVTRLKLTGVVLSMLSTFLIYYFKQ